jgi:hypothetical protein
MQYRNFNNKSILQVTSLDFADQKNRSSYYVNQPGTGFPLFDWNIIQKIQEPALDKALDELGYRQPQDQTTIKEPTI